MSIATNENSPSKSQMKRVKILRHAEAKELEMQINSFLENVDYSLPITFPVTVTIVPELIQECYVALIEYWTLKPEEPKPGARKIHFKSASITTEHSTIHFSPGELEYLEEQGV